MGALMRVRLFVVAFFAVLSVSQISAQSGEPPFARGIYFAGSARYSTVGGGFDGQSFFNVNNGAEIILIPQWLPFTRTNFQPYLAAGVGISTLTVRNGSSDGVDVGDGTFYLGGFRAGLGIEIWMNRQFFLRFQGIYRIDRVVSVQGVNRSRIELNDPLNADGYELSLIIGAVIF